MDNEYSLISLEQIEQLLGQQEFVWFLKTLLLNIGNQSAQLQSCLERAEWQQAKDLAHQLKGVSYLAGNENLSKHLEDIELQHTQLISAQAFQHKLRQAFDNFQHHINQFIDVDAS